MDNTGNFDDSGVIDTLEFDAIKGKTPHIVNVSGDIYAIAYAGDGDDGFLITVDINNAGDIDDGGVIDTLEFDGAKGATPHLINISGDIYAIAYAGNGDIGIVKTIDIDSTGDIDDGGVIDTLEFDGVRGKVPSIISVGGNFYAIAYQGNGDIGVVITIESLVNYPTDKPSINPVISYAVSGVDQWTSFTETAIKEGSSEIYYQLSDNDGSTWQYWNGSFWATVGASNYNTATVINSNINSFSTTTGDIMFKAFLESDGTGQVQLDKVQISWNEEVESGGYAISAYLISSAFDMTDIASVQVIEWDQATPFCSPACEIKFQIQTATTQGGLSSAEWSGPSGKDGNETDYFITSTGQLIHTDHNGDQWVRYKIFLLGDGSDTPVLEEVRINYK